MRPRFPKAPLIAFFQAVAIGLTGIACTSVPKAERKVSSEPDGGNKPALFGRRDIPGFKAYMACKVPGFPGTIFYFSDEVIKAATSKETNLFRSQVYFGSDDNHLWLGNVYLSEGRVNRVSAPLSSFGKGRFSLAETMKSDTFLLMLPDDPERKQDYLMATCSPDTDSLSPASGLE